MDRNFAKRILSQRVKPKVTFMNLITKLHMCIPSSIINTIVELCLKTKRTNFLNFLWQLTYTFLGCLMKVRLNLLSGWVRRTFYRFVPTVREGFPELKNTKTQMNIAGKFLNKPLCCPGGGYYKIKSFVNWAELRFRAFSPLSERIDEHTSHRCHIYEYSEIPDFSLIKVKFPSPNKWETKI